MLSSSGDSSFGVFSSFGASSWMCLAMSRVCLILMGAAAAAGSGPGGGGGGSGGGRGRGLIPQSWIGCGPGPKRPKQGKQRRAVGIAASASLRGPRTCAASVTCAAAGGHQQPATSVGCCLRPTHHQGGRRTLSWGTATGKPWSTSANTNTRLALIRKPLVQHHYHN